MCVFAGKKKSGKVWGAAHDKEIKRQNQQREARLAEVAESGCIGLTPSLKRKAQALKESRDKRRARFDALAKKRAATTTRPSYELRHKRVFVESGMDDTTVRDAMLKHHFRRVVERSQAFQNLINFHHQVLFTHPCLKNKIERRMCSSTTTSQI